MCNVTHSLKESEQPKNGGVLVYIHGGCSVKGST